MWTNVSRAYLLLVCSKLTWYTCCLMRRTTEKRLFMPLFFITAVAGVFVCYPHGCSVICNVSGAWMHIVFINQLCMIIPAFLPFLAERENTCIRSLEGFVCSSVLLRSTLPYVAAYEPVVCISMRLLFVVSDQLKLIRNLKLILWCSYHLEVKRDWICE